MLDAMNPYGNAEKGAKVENVVESVCTTTFVWLGGIVLAVIGVATWLKIRKRY
jgi:hypothetical protein